MTISTETIRDAAEVLDTLTSTLAVDHPLRARATARAKSCVSGLYSAADALDAQTAEIAKANSQVERWKKVAESAEDRAQVAADEIDRLRDAAQMLADWAEHEVGAEPDLTPGLAEVRAALSGESND